MTKNFLKMYNTQNKEIRANRKEFLEMFAKHQADMEYIAMMTDVDLEEGEEDEQEI
jgi:hypothetical protein